MVEGSPACWSGRTGSSPGSQAGQVVGLTDPAEGDGSLDEALRTWFGQVLVDADRHASAR
jgi:hypothetical protein